MYAIVRLDLEMSPGKLAAQTGHAFLDTYDQCRKEYPDRAAQYHADGHGTKVVLGARNAVHLEWLYEQAQHAGLPCTRIVDSGHVLLPHFDGSPVLTAIGIGPVIRNEIPFVKRLNLIR